MPARSNHKIWYVCLQYSVPVIQSAVAGRLGQECLRLGIPARHGRPRRYGGSLANWWKWRNGVCGFQGQFMHAVNKMHTARERERGASYWAAGSCGVFRLSGKKWREYARRGGLAWRLAVFWFAKHRHTRAGQSRRVERNSRRPALNLLNRPS